MYVHFVLLRVLVCVMFFFKKHLGSNLWLLLVFRFTCVEVKEIHSKLDGFLRHRWGCDTRWSNCWWNWWMMSRFHSGFHWHGNGKIPSSIHFQKAEKVHFSIAMLVYQGNCLFGCCVFAWLVCSYNSVLTMGLILSAVHKESFAKHRSKIIKATWWNGFYRLS